MKIDKMYLEVTRNCTLECEHCLRGNKEVKDMDLITLENSLKDVQEINTLLLTGGEPLLNIKLLNELPKLIDKYQLKINNISIITNGTVASVEHVNALTILGKKCDNLDLILSSDLFHRLEWMRLQLLDKVEKNYQFYKEYLPIRKYLDNDSFHSIILQSKGRAKSLTEERLKELEKKYYIKYKMCDEEEENIIKRDNDYVYGKLYINVFGNVTPYNISFNDEDDCYETNLNINNMSLNNIINCINNEEVYTRKLTK